MKRLVFCFAVALAAATPLAAQQPDTAAARRLKNANDAIAVGERIIAAAGQADTAMRRAGIEILAKAYVDVADKLDRTQEELARIADAHYRLHPGDASPEFRLLMLQTAQNARTIQLLNLIWVKPR